MRLNNTYKTLFSFIALTAIAFSCSQALEEEPRSFFSEDAIYATPEGVESAINGLYFGLQAFDYYGSNFHNLVLPTSGLFWSSQVANQDATSLNTQSSNINLTSMWAGVYQLINTANIAIANLEGKPNDFSNKDSALGHAYLLRGQAYLDLVRMFGGVPLKTLPLSIDEIHLPRADKAAVVAQIVDDLTKASSLIPDVGKTINGRPSKWAANVLLARLFIFMAADDPSNWQKAHDVLLPVIESGNFKLLPTYKDVFDLSNENHQESIWELQYGYTGGGRTSDMIRLFTPSNSIFTPPTSNTFGRLRPNKEVFDQHLAQYPDDPRIDAAYLYDSYPRNNGTSQNIYPKNKKGNNGYTVITKWFDPGFDGTNTERNFIMIRYADVLLMMAEIQNELSGPAMSYTYVNQVLSRARDIDGDGLSDSVEPADWAGMSQEEFRTRIMIERRYELLGEGQDWFDTRRRGYEFFKESVITPHNTNPTFDTGKDFMYPDDTKNMLLPIPLSEISGNQLIGPEDQNPGY